MRLIAPLLAVPAACLVLASPAAAGTDLPRYTPGYPGHVGVAAKYDSNERETNRTDSDPRNRHTRVTDKTEATGQAHTSQNYPGSFPEWSSFQCPDEAHGGCSGADTRSHASADVGAGRLETSVLSWVHLGYRPFEASAANTATAHVDDTIPLSAPATVTLRGRVRGSTEGVQSTGEVWPLHVKLLFQRPDPSGGEGLIVEGLDGTYEGPHFDETFEVPVDLPKGTFPFNAEVFAEVNPELFDGSTFVRDQAMIDNASGERGVTFEIVVPDDVTVSSGSGKLPIVGGAQTPTDTTPPVLNLPGLQVIDATGPGGATVSYSARATDDSGQDPAVQCSPASGTMFPIGLHQVSCAATDAAGNRATGTFPVRIASAAEQLDSLIARVSTLPRSLRITLGAIAGRSKPVQCVGLRTFTVLVIALRRLNSITDADVRDLNGRAERIRAVLAC